MIKLLWCYRRLPNPTAKGQNNPILVKEKNTIKTYNLSTREPKLLQQVFTARRNMVMLYLKVKEIPIFKNTN
ncbi:hypothetical protein [Spiroplasma poulsonii]|uniref:hypothetical protein n=1 Tax=Spiroplasma poulsonii TaxID=2138 RepID=UPI001F4D00CE|nr:hypothetical protein [Spiroplasma poulsonii]UNF62550.1 hypothetical protein MNU24_03595 [Spiroplasma poulsonii]